MANVNWTNIDDNSGSIVIDAQVSETNMRFWFNIVTREQLNSNVDITDHLVEDNIYVQDHIAIKPVTYKLSGLVSEKSFTPPDVKEITVPAEPLSAQLSTLSSFVPSLSSYVYSAINAVESVYKRVNKVVGTAINSYKNVESIYNRISKLNLSSFQKGNLTYSQYGQKLKNTLLGSGSTIWSKNQNESKVNWDKDYIQFSSYMIFYNLMVNRTPVNLFTGWGAYLGENFYITDVQMVQENTYQQSSLEVTVKQLRFTSVITREATANELANRNNILALQQEESDESKKDEGTQPRSRLSQWYDENINKLKGKGE